MKNLTIIYQHNRKIVNCDLYYPEDTNIPKKRVEFIKNFKRNLNQQCNSCIIVSACPYII